MAEIVNLRMARKRAARERKTVEAERNRALFGETLAAGDIRRREAERAKRLIEGHRRDRSDTPE